jgi:hypothetical protein
MGEDRCPQCGKALVQPRTGRRAKFCSTKCRVAYHQGQGNVARFKAKPPSSAGSITKADLVATLEWLFNELARDVRVRGAMVDGKVNPAVAPLQRIVADLTRMAPPEVVEPLAATLLELVGPPEGPGAG